MSLNNYGNQLLEQIKQQQKQQEEVSPFVVAPTQEWMNQASKMKKPNQLLGDLWYEGELCVFFSDSNAGKTIFTVQLCDALSRGKDIAPFKNQVPSQTVLFLDFELSAKQFQLRYTDEGGQMYQFHPNFKRAEYRCLSVPKRYKNEQAYMLACIRATVKKEGVKVLVVDNITFVTADTTDSKAVTEFVKELKNIKDELGISILLIGHAKKRDIFNTLSRNDLFGSSQMFNFIDTCFALGKGRNDERFLKQLKARNTEVIYTSKNVIIYEIEKRGCRTYFEYQSKGTEYRLLSEDSLINDNDIWKAYEGGSSISEIARNMGTYHNKIKRIVTRLKAQKEEEAKLQSKHEKEWQSFVDENKK